MAYQVLRSQKFMEKQQRYIVASVTKQVAAKSSIKKNLIVTNARKAVADVDQ